MESLFLSNLTSPPLLFFFLGALAAFVRPDLEIPTQVATFLSLYLLFAIGFKGGAALAESDLGAAVWSSLGAALLLSVVVPLIIFALMRRRLAAADAAAVAATYGSISAVTFVTATAYLDSSNITWSGHLVAAMALMESPAIVIGILLYRLYRDDAKESGQERINWKQLGRESCLNGSVFLIVGSLVVGWISGSDGKSQVSTFASDIFIGMLCLFLLDMGIVAARRLQEVGQTNADRQIGLPGMVGWGVSFALGNALLAGALAWAIGLPEGDALLLTVLGASASYIAVPAAMRLALPDANPSIFLPMSLAVTFPFNLLIGIPMYHQALRWVLP